jgi:ketosteroid isomerase-like protein
MRGRSTMFALACIQLMIIGCKPGSQRFGDLTAQDSVALRKIADRDAPIVLARDWDALAAEYAKDAVRMPPNGPAVQGRDAIRQMLQQTPPISAFAFRLVDLQGDGNLAYMRGAWSMTLAPTGAPKPVSDSGKILVVLRKESDGSWVRVADAWNSDAPPK